MTTKKLTTSAIYIALYVILMFFNQAFAFGAVQVRVATALYGLVWVFPFLIVPSALANMLSNTLYGGLGIIDILGGALVGLLTALAIYTLKRIGAPQWTVFFPVTLIPGIVVPLYLHSLIHVPVLPLMASLLVGQAICGIVSIALVSAMEKRLAKEPSWSNVIKKG